MSPEETAGAPGSHPDPALDRAAAERAMAATVRQEGLDVATVEELLGLVGHELRAPLAIIEGSAWLLLDSGEPVSADAHDHLDRIHRNARLGLLLLDRLDDVRAVDAGLLALNTSPVDVGALVSNTVEDLHEAVLGRRDVRVDVVPAAPLVCDADATRLRQIIFNLLANAALNTHPDAAVNVIVRRGDGVAVVEVRDEGHGVAPEDAERLFEKFPVLSAARQGAGIGLYLSRGIARAHGGELRAMPSPQGEGGIFVLTLPLAG